MAYAPECQPIADQIATLTAQEQKQIAAIAPLDGVDKWKAMEALGALRQQIAEQQALLDTCQKQHGLDLTAEIAVTDLTGKSGPNRIGRIWQLTADGQAVKQTYTVQDGAITFEGVLGSNRQSLAITIEETDNPTVNGPDFRSGPLPASAAGGDADPIRRIEIVILDPIVISMDALRAALPPLPIQQSIPVESVGNVNIAVTALDFTIQNSSVTLSANGTASAVGTTSPFTFSATLHIAPVFTMAPSVLLDVAPAGQPSLSMSGLAGAVVQNLASLLSPTLTDQILQQLKPVVNTFVINSVTEMLGLSTLPSGAVLSIRQVTVDEQEASITPVLGAFGTVLSDFKPGARTVTPALDSIQLEQTTIGTVTGISGGRVVLAQPAPAGGVTVQLSNDCAGNVQIVPAALTIPEGQRAGEFTITGITQPIGVPIPNDCNVYAALGEQRIQTTISLTGQTPQGVAPPPAPPSATSAQLGIASIEVTSTVPIPLFRPVNGVVTLNGVAYVETVVTVRTSIPSMIPFPIAIPAGTNKGTFSFVLTEAPPQSGVLIIYATTGPGSSMTISVPVQV